MEQPPPHTRSYYDILNVDTPISWWLTPLPKVDGTSTAFSSIPTDAAIQDALKRSWEDVIELYPSRVRSCCTIFLSAVECILANRFGAAAAGRKSDKDDASEHAEAVKQDDSDNYKSDGAIRAVIFLPMPLGDALSAVLHLLELSSSLPMLCHRVARAHGGRLDTVPDATTMGRDITRYQHSFLEAMREVRVQLVASIPEINTFLATAHDSPATVANLLFLGICGLDCLLPDLAAAGTASETSSTVQAGGEGVSEPAIPPPPPPASASQAMASPSIASLAKLLAVVKNTAAYVELLRDGRAKLDVHCSLVSPLRMIAATHEGKESMPKDSILQTRSLLEEDARRYSFAHSPLIQLLYRVGVTIRTAR